MIATLKGRLQTKIITYVILALVTAVFASLYHPAFILMAIIAMIVGLIIETILGIWLVWQTGWITWFAALVEFLAIANTAIFMNIPISLNLALVYYFTAWTIIQLLLIYILPVWKTNWHDKGLELW